MSMTPRKLITKFLNDPDVDLDGDLNVTIISEEGEDDDPETREIVDIENNEDGTPTILIK